ncbi:hypothetical protein [Streptomyces sp. NPDC049879]|uniref:hypothetical protein n=1 Tax=Streptomyces sp. NPDC049879 TaxID=3365598 RepID=UPI00378AE9F3
MVLSCGPASAGAVGGALTPPQGASRPRLNAAPGGPYDGAPRAYRRPRRAPAYAADLRVRPSRAGRCRLLGAASEPRRAAAVGPARTPERRAAVRDVTVMQIT